jgi:hypothetical protein
MVSSNVRVVADDIGALEREVYEERVGQVLGRPAVGADDRAVGQRCILELESAEPPRRVQRELRLTGEAGGSGRQQELCRPGSSAGGEQEVIGVQRTLDSDLGAVQHVAITATLSGDGLGSAIPGGTAFGMCPHQDG